MRNNKNSIGENVILFLVAIGVFAIIGLSLIHIYYNTNAINVAKAVHKETNCPLCASDTGENQYWPVLFYGRDLADSADGVFSYKMREPLREAIKALE